SLEGHLPENYFTVGQPIYLNVTATSVDGKTYTTEGLGGSVDIDYNYDVYAHDGIIYKGNGEFEIRDLETIENDAVIFVITDKFRPELTTKIKVPVSYENTPICDRFAGSNGKEGILPLKEETCTGRKGRPGGNGTSGTNAHDLIVF